MSHENGREKLSKKTFENEWKERKNVVLREDGSGKLLVTHLECNCKLRAFFQISYHSLLYIQDEFGNIHIFPTHTAQTLSKDSCNFRRCSPALALVLVFNSSILLHHMSSCHMLWKGIYAKEKGEGGGCGTHLIFALLYGKRKSKSYGGMKGVISCILRVMKGERNDFS